MPKKKKWSKKVTETSDAMTLDKGVFKKSPHAIAVSLKRSAGAKPAEKIHTIPLRHVHADIL